MMMMMDMQYTTVSNVISSWEQIRRMPGYEETTGFALIKKLFELEPTTKAFFGFSVSADVESELSKDPRFIESAKDFIELIDRALTLLGPDIELLSDMMLALGMKLLVSYGVKPEQYTSMGRALIHVLQEQLGSHFTKEIRDAWVDLYGTVSSEMIRAQQAMRQQGKKCER